MVSDEAIDAAAKADCCAECDCLPAASYCAIKRDRERIARILTAALPHLQAEWQEIGDEARNGSLILAGSINHDTRAVVGFVAGTGDPEDPLNGEDHWDDSGILNRAASVYFNARFFTHWTPLPAAPQALVADYCQPEAK